MACVYSCVCICMHVYICVCICMHVYMCKIAYGHVCVFACVLCMHIHMCMYVWMSCMIARSLRQYYSGNLSRPRLIWLIGSGDGGCVRSSGVLLSEPARSGSGASHASAATDSCRHPGRDSGRGAAAEEEVGKLNVRDGVAVCCVLCVVCCMLAICGHLGHLLLVGCA